MEHREWAFYPPPDHPADPGLPTAADLTVGPAPGPPAPRMVAAPTFAARPEPPGPRPPATLSRYPRDDVDRPRRLAAVSGSFWREIVDDAREPAGLARGAAAAWRRVADALEEASDAVAFGAIPLRRTVEWTPIAVVESEPRPPAPARAFGRDGGRFADGGPAYGEAAAGRLRVPIGPFDDVPALVDSPAAASLLWTRGVDYDVADGWITLRRDPFEATARARGAAGGRTMTLWLWRARRDDRLLARRVGGVLGPPLPSTPAAAALVAAALDALHDGGSELSLRRAFAAAHDAPLCAVDGEVVAAVGRDAAGPYVVTSASAYRLPAAAAPVVAVGDVLALGDPIGDAVLFDPLGPGIPPGLTTFAPPPGLLPAGPGVAFGPGPATIRLEATRPTAAGPGPLHATWDLGGGAAERRFWAAVRAREVATGTYVADRLAGVGAGRHAAAADVPATVAPLETLFRDALRGCGLLVRTRAAACGPDAIGPAAAWLLHASAPPHGAVVVLAELAAAAAEFGPPAGSEAGSAASDPPPAGSSSAGIDVAADAAFARALS